MFVFVGGIRVQRRICATREIRRSYRHDRLRFGPIIGIFFQSFRFEKISDVEVHGEEYENLQGLFGLRMRVARMKLGNETIELTQYLAPEGRPIPADWRSHDHAFQHIAIVVSDMDRAYQQLRAHKVRHASTGPQTIPRATKPPLASALSTSKIPTAIISKSSIFLPARAIHAGSGRTDKLFLGIDHTAIVVSNTQNSLKFYRDVLGMRLAGESMNFGTEQEHLNNVAGARLRISGLKAASGPGIEFLEYLPARWPPRAERYPRQ